VLADVANIAEVAQILKQGRLSEVRFFEDYMIDPNAIGGMIDVDDVWGPMDALANTLGV
jgi:hypothetical protein